MERIKSWYKRAHHSRPPPPEADMIWMWRLCALPSPYKGKDWQASFTPAHLLTLALNEGGGEEGFEEGRRGFLNEFRDYLGVSFNHSL